MKKLILLLCTFFVFGVAAQAQCFVQYSYSLNDNTISFSTFVSPSASQISQWLWQFGDGNTANIQFPTHTYTADGVYNVCVSIVANNGCTANYCDNITIGNPQQDCTAAFTYNVSGNTVAFTSTSTNATAYTWVFSDGATANTANTSHTFAGGGEYEVCLTASNGNGCLQTTCQTIVIGNPACEAAFQANVGGATVTIVNNSANADSTFVMWGDGTALSNISSTATHTYTVSGTYTICVTALNNEGSCSDQSCQVFNITLPVNSGNISGSILGENNIPVADITINLVSDGTTVATTTSDANGAFSFSNVPLGSYNLEIQSNNYQQNDLELVNISAIVPNISNLVVQVTPIQGIESFNNTLTLQVLPNPVSDVCKVQIYPLNEIGTLTLYDIMGKQLWKNDITSGTQQIIVPMQDLPTGTYFLLQSAGIKMIAKASLIKM